MRTLKNSFHTISRAALAVLVLALGLSSAPQKPYNIHQKAYYADPQSVEYVSPGLTITINSAAIANDGTITTTYTLTDPTGLPLDSAGVQTPGTISVSFIAATIPSGQEQYTAYTTKVATGTVIASTNQPGADSGGTSTSIGPGQYQYVFHTKAPTGFDVTATHTIGIYGSRNLTAYNFPTDYASATYNFVPNGAKVTVTRDVIETASCNQCHNELSAHGGSRRGLNMCVLCHTPQNVDPNTGDTLDAKVFYHKIHMGQNLPSVVAGGQYIPAINSFGTFNFSTVIFPLDGNVKDPRNCEVCHQQTTGAAQAKAFMLEPSRAACGSCHDDVNFATGANHPGGIQTTDTECANCHIPQGEMDFDASILGAHVVPINSSLLQGLTVKITNVANGSAGKSPTISFTLLNSAGAAVPLSLSGLSLSVTMTGPTTDYGTTSFGSGVTTPGYVTESMTTGATCDNNGNCQYTMTHQVPAGATGTFAVGIEARRTDTVPELVNGQTVQTGIEYGTPNPVSYFSVDGSAVAPRRTVIALTNCNTCHQFISEHGGLRNNTEYCVFCHNPSNTDVSQRPSGPKPYNTQPDQGINFNLLVHRIHYGLNQPANRPYIVIGFGGSVENFSQILFPVLSPSGEATNLAICSVCHVNSSEQNDLALTGLNPVTDPQGPINPIQPFSSACTGCHMDIATAAHTLSNTTSLGEACNVCHGSGAAYAVDQVHAQY
ncbi:MAG TPA: OmcA/MtrC family decaheme c-type cytochrome [Bryobacteraceae bacterium]|nr:OmcA/MtrC family decaheme c-type cytochrome [Bryobacteraceae bacterium]